MLVETLRVYETTLKWSVDPKRGELKTEPGGTSAFGSYMECPQWVTPTVSELETKSIQADGRNACLSLP